MPKYSVIIDIPYVDYPGGEDQLIDHFKYLLSNSPLNLRGNVVAVTNENKKKQAPPFLWDLPPKEQEEQMKKIGLTPPIGPDEEK